MSLTTNPAGYSQSSRLEADMTRALAAIGQRPGAMSSAGSVSTSLVLASDSVRGGGVLSGRTFTENMRVIDDKLIEYARTHSVSLQAINEAGSTFLEICNKSVREVSQMQSELMKLRSSPDFKMHFENAKLLLGFSTEANQSISAQTTSALTIARNTTEAEKESTLAALAVIIKGRTDQLTLFTSHLVALRAQDTEHLKIMLQLHNLDLQQGEQFFAQMKEVALFKAEREDAAATHELEVQKTEMTHKLALLSHRLQEQVTANTQQIAVMEAATKSETAKRAHLAELERLKLAHAEVMRREEREEHVGIVDAQGKVRTVEIQTAGSVQRDQIAADADVRKTVETQETEREKSHDTAGVEKAKAATVAKTEQKKSEDAKEAAIAKAEQESKAEQVKALSMIPKAGAGCIVM